MASSDTTAKISGPSRRLYISKEMKEEMDALDTNDPNDCCYEMGLPYFSQKKEGVFIDVIWYRAKDTVYELPLDEFAVTHKYGDRLLQFCNEENSRRNFYAKNPEVYDGLVSLRRPCYEMAKYPKNFVLIKKSTNERVRVTRHSDHLVWPWRAHLEQSMFVQHVDENGQRQRNNRSGWVTNAEVIVCPDLNLQPKDQESRDMILIELADMVKGLWKSRREMLEFLLEKLAGRMYLTLHSSNVRRMRSVSQDIPGGLVERELEPRLRCLVVPFEVSGGRQQFLRFQITDVAQLVGLLPRDALMRDGEAEGDVLFVLCTPEHPTIFDYNYGTGSQKLTVQFEVAQGNPSDVTVYSG